MKPLILALAALLPALPLSAQEQKSGDLGGGFNEITKAISDAKKRSAGETAKAAKAAAETEKARAAARSWTFAQASSEFKDEPGRTVTLATTEIEALKGRWALAAYADDDANAGGAESFASARRVLELSHEGFRFAGEKGWRKYDAGADAEMRLVEETKGLGKNGPEVQVRVTYCAKPGASGELLCKTTSTSRSGEKSDSGGKAKPRPVVSYSKYVRS